MNPLTYTWQAQAKALVASAIASLTALKGALPDGVVTPEEWVSVALAGLISYAAVFGVKNR